MSEHNVADPQWYKDAVIYQLHVKSFFDSNNDGVGDFQGLIQKLDYLAELGVTAIWLLPFYPSPRRDDGYDIAEYRDVQPVLRHARRMFKPVLIAEAHARGLARHHRTGDQPHVSDQHPWFQRARLAPAGSTERDLLRLERTPILKLRRARASSSAIRKRSNWSVGP